MAVDVGEGLRGSATSGVRKIPPIEPLRLGYQRDPNASQFRENLQKCLEEKKAKGAEVLHRVKHSYDRLYSRFGVEPNTVMLSTDCVSAVIAECFHEYQVINMKPDKLLGMDVVMTTDKDFVKVCIVDTEGTDVCTVLPEYTCGRTKRWQRRYAVRLLLYVLQLFLMLPRTTR